MIKKPTDASGVHLWLILWKTYRAFQEVAHADIARYGLCLSDFGVLEILLHKGPLPVNALGEKLRLTSGSITTAVDRLESLTYVKRDKCDRDQRVTYVKLTASGRKFIGTAFQQHSEVLEETAAPLTRQERTTLIRLLKKAGRHAAQ